MSIGLTVDSSEGEIETTHYCQNTAEEAMSGFFEVLKEQGLSDFGDYLVDGEAFFGEAIAKLPDPSNPTPEQISAIEAQMGDHDSADVLREAEKAFKAMQDMDDDAFAYEKQGLISEFEEDLLPALREAVEKKLRIELTMA